LIRKLLKRVKIQFKLNKIKKEYTKLCRDRLTNKIKEGLKTKIEKNVNDLHDYLRDSAEIEKIKCILNKISRNDGRLSDILAVMEKFTVLGLLKPFERQETNTVKHNQLVVEAFEELETENYEYFNKRRAGEALLPEDVFLRISEFDAETRLNSQSRKTHALRVVLHDYGKILAGDHPQDGSILVENLLETLDLSPIEVQEVSTDIKYHDYLFGLASGENVPGYLSNDLYANRNIEGVLKKMLPMHLADITSARMESGNVTTAFLNELIMYFDERDSFFDSNVDWAKARLLKFLFFEDPTTLCTPSGFDNKFEELVPDQVKNAFYKAIDLSNSQFKKFLNEVRLRYAFAILAKRRTKIQSEYLVPFLFLLSELIRLLEPGGKKIEVIMFTNDKCSKEIEGYMDNIQSSGQQSLIEIRKLLEEKVLSTPNNTEEYSFILSVNPRIEIGIEKKEGIIVVNIS